MNLAEQLALYDGIRTKKNQHKTWKNKKPKYQGLELKKSEESVALLPAFERPFFKTYVVRRDYENLCWIKG